MRKIHVRYRPGLGRCNKCDALLAYDELYKHPRADLHPRTSLCSDCHDIASGAKYARMLEEQKARQKEVQLTLFQQ
jgi:hypothetical protein